MRVPLATRVAALVVANVLVTAAATFVAFRAMSAFGDEPSFRAWALALLLAIPFAVWSAHAAMRDAVRRISAIGDGVRALAESDFSLRVPAEGGDEISGLVRLYNEVADVLRLERNDVYQRELLLDAILQRSPIAVLLVNSADRIVYSNGAARELFARGARLDGKSFAEVEEAGPDEFREALAAPGDSLFTAHADDHDETFRLSQRVVTLNTQRHRMILLERLTPEIRRQEIHVWKTAIRVINHELNNSLAPVSSLFHSASLVQGRPEQMHRLPEIYDAIEERLQHLRRFLEGYAQFARLPKPVAEAVAWRPFLEELRQLYPFRVEGEPPPSGRFDRGQMQQVLINLLKNAYESGSDDVVVAVEATPGGSRLRVMDRGQGMSEQTMRQAMLPFYSTKPGGTGLGLALCSEIIEAHGGSLRVQAREGGGTIVTFWIPAGE